MAVCILTARPGVRRGVALARALLTALAAALLIAGSIAPDAGWAVGIAAVAFIGCVQSCALSWRSHRSLSHYAEGPADPDGAPWWWAEFEREYLRYTRGAERRSGRYVSLLRRPKRDASRGRERLTPG